MLYEVITIQYLHNPFEFDEMEDIVDRIRVAVSEGEKVKIFGDRDADGITSTVLLYNELKSMGVDVEWRLPEGDDPYGLTISSVDEFAARDGSLFITVDCGISNYNEIKHASDLGIETIVIDHHNSPEELPPAYGIVNPVITSYSIHYTKLYEIRQVIFHRGIRNAERTALA